jgi:hypothetical protein
MRRLPLLEKPKTDIKGMKGKELADELRGFAERQGIDLALADLGETKKILKKLPSSLSDEIVRMREGSD